MGDKILKFLSPTDKITRITCSCEWASDYLQPCITISILLVLLNIS